MKVAIVGSRTLNNPVVRSFLFETLDSVRDKISCIVSGGAVGPDYFAFEYVMKNGGKFVLYRPEYDKHGKGATFLRNSLIINEADVTLVFWDGESRGTMDSLNKAKKSGRKVVLYTFKGENHTTEKFNYE